MFTGYGYQVRFVENMNDIDADMAVSMEWAYKEIRSIQKAAREGKPIFKPRFVDSYTYTSPSHPSYLPWLVVYALASLSHNIVFIPSLLLL